MKKRILAITACSLLLIAGFSIKPAMAYFTSVTEASGKVAIKIGTPPTTVDESETKPGTMIKKVKIKNTGDFDCYIRVRAITGSNYSVVMNENANWKMGTDDNGTYYEFVNVVPVGESTDELVLSITVDKESITNDFNVIIVQEAAKVHYDEAGKPYADWTDSYNDQFEIQPTETEEEGNN